MIFYFSIGDRCQKILFLSNMLLSLYFTILYTIILQGRKVVKTDRSDQVTQNKWSCHCWQDNSAYKLNTSHFPTNLFSFLFKSYCGIFLCLKWNYLNKIFSCTDIPIVLLHKELGITYMYELKSYLPFPHLPFLQSPLPGSV